MDPTNSPSGWQPDPTGRYEFRFFNGERWTSDVSVHGQRFIDPAGAPLAQTGRASLGGSAVLSPRRGFALASFWVGLGSFVLGWVPFVFVLGVAGAVTSIVFGVIALRRAHRATGRGAGFAFAGIVLAIATFGAAIAGFFFTRSVIREFDNFVDPGPNRTQIDGCIANGGLVTVDGSITNLDDVRHDYSITVRYRVDGDIVATDVADVQQVDAGETGTFHVTEFISDTTAAVECTVDSVSGPLPFGINN